MTQEEWCNWSIGIASRAPDWWAWMLHCMTLWDLSEGRLGAACSLSEMLVGFVPVFKKLNYSLESGCLLCISKTHWKSQPCVAVLCCRCCSCHCLASFHVWHLSALLQPSWEAELLLCSSEAPEESWTSELVQSGVTFLLQAIFVSDTFASALWVLQSRGGLSAGLLCWSRVWSLCYELPSADAPHGLASLMLKPHNISGEGTCVLFRVALVIHLLFWLR